MIKIENQENLKLIKASVSEFTSSITYCEHQIPFYIQGIRPSKKLHTSEGSAAHKLEQVLERETTTLVPMSDAQMADVTYDFELIRDNIFTRMLYPFQIGQQNISVVLNGRADKIMRSNGTLIVQDDKFPGDVSRYEERSQPYDGDKLQVLVYLNSKFNHKGMWDESAWFDIPHQQKEWIICVKDKNNGNKPCKTFRSLQSADDMSYLSSSIERFAKLVLEMEGRRHHNRATICAACGFVDQCRFRLVTPPSS